MSAPLATQDSVLQAPATGALYVWSGGMLEQQAPSYSGTFQGTYYSACTETYRWNACLTGDMTGTNYGLSGTFEFTPSSPQVVYFRVILVHQGIEQILVESPVNLQSGYQKITGFNLAGPDPTAAPGDELVFEMDPRGLKGKLTMYWGAKLTIPETTISERANFTEHVIDKSFPGTDSVMAADVDRDGDMDIVTGDFWNHAITWWENTGGQNFVKHVIDANVTLSSSRSIYLGVADMDRDGDMDIVAPTDYGKVTWWENNGSQVFTRHTIDIDLYSVKSVFPVDFDKDGDIDIVVGGSDLVWLENDGRQQFTKHTIISGSALDAFYVADVNKDGKWDVITTSLNGGIHWWKNSGTQTFTKQTIVADGTSTSSGSAVCAADLDRDGDIDIIASPVGSNAISWWENDGHENFTRHALGASFKVGQLYAVDMDADGDIDIMGAGTASAWWENNGGQSFFRHVIGDSSGAIHPADLDKDGDIDFASAGSFQFSWFENKSSVSPPPKATLISPSGTINTNKPTYKWNAVPSSTYYQLWVNDSSGGQKIKNWYTPAECGCASGTGTCSVTPSAALAAGNATWWLQTWNATGDGPWSEGMSFTVAGGGGLPGMATLVSPSGNSTTNTPTYSWNAVSNATWYFLWVNDGSAASGRIQTWYSAEQAGCPAGAGICSVTPSAVLTPGSCEWWIQTWNDAGYGPWSDGMKFELGGSGLPGKAILISPAGTIASGTPTYSWNAVPTSTWYYLWVSLNSGSAKIQRWYTAEQAGCPSGTGTCSAASPMALGTGAYRWWIQTWNDGGYGPWSDFLTFAVSAAGNATNF